MDARSCDADDIFRIYTACPQDIATILLDVREHKHFKQLHLFNAFCVRVSTNGKVLAVRCNAVPSVSSSFGTGPQSSLFFFPGSTPQAYVQCRVRQEAGSKQATGCRVFRQG